MGNRILDIMKSFVLITLLYVVTGCVNKQPVVIEEEISIYDEHHKPPEHLLYDCEGKYAKDGFCALERELDRLKQ